MSFDRVRVSTGAAEEVNTPHFHQQSSGETQRLALDVSTSSQGEGSMTGGRFSLKLFALVVVGAIALGTGSGWALARFMPTNTSGGSFANAEIEETAAADVAGKIQAGAVFGVPDEKTFRDQTEGVLIKGGINGEGSHTLLREGGKSQNVYLTSSIVDLDQFDGMNVRIWGETFKGQKAGWLMDVGRLEIKATTATKPDWYTQEQTKESGKKAAPQEE